jgi:hypothetical protein
MHRLPRQSVSLLRMNNLTNHLHFITLLLDSGSGFDSKETTEIHNDLDRLTQQWK